MFILVLEKEIAWWKENVYRRTPVNASRVCIFQGNITGGSLAMKGVHGSVALITAKTCIFTPSMERP